MNCNKYWFVVFASYLFALSNGGYIRASYAIQTLSSNGQSSQQPNNKETQEWNPSNYKIKRFSYLWSIDNFSLCSQKYGKFLSSPTFPEATADSHFKWSIGLYPERSNEQYQDNISIYIWLREPKLAAGKILATYKFSILDQNGNYRNLKLSDRPKEFHSNEGWGFDSYISRDILFDAKEGLLPGDKLTIYCEIDALIKSNKVALAEVEGQSTAQIDNPANQLEQLYKSQEFNDLIISIGHRQFKAHKLILTASSPMFKAMLSCDLMKESQIDSLTLSDIQPDVFQEVLRFIYTGKISLQTEGPINEQEVDRRQRAVELFKVSDNYKLDGLKSICERVLAQAISIDSAGELLIVAHLHEGPELKNNVIGFIRNNYRQLFQTIDWISRFKEAPTELILELNREIFM